MVGECCQSKDFNDVCEDCHLGLVVFFMQNQKNVMGYLMKYNPKLFQYLKTASFKL